jgi:hypothetical protein
VVFPTADAVTYDPAQKLRDIALKGGSGDGVFMWNDPDSVPTVNNVGYKVMFTPNDTVNYDYTGVVRQAAVSLTVNKADQTITFPAISDKQRHDAPFNVNVSVNTALPLTYQSSDTSVATISSDGLVTIVDSGTVTVTVSQAGDDNYNPASAAQTFTIYGQPQSVITENTRRGNTGIYPNPVRAGEYMQVEGVEVIEIRELTGRLLQRENVKGAAQVKAPGKAGIYMINNKKLIVL